MIWATIYYWLTDELCRSAAYFRFVSAFCFTCKRRWNKTEIKQSRLKQTWNNFCFISVSFQFYFTCKSRLKGDSHSDCHPLGGSYMWNNKLVFQLLKIQINSKTIHHKLTTETKILQCNLQSTRKENKLMLCLLSLCQNVILTKCTTEN